MTPSARQRQARYRQKKRSAGYHRLEVWVPPDLMAELDRRWKPYGDFCRPQLGLLELARRGARLKKPAR